LISVTSWIAESAHTPIDFPARKTHHRRPYEKNILFD